jgi:hypothetical protein
MAVSQDKSKDSKTTSKDKDKTPTTSGDNQDKVTEQDVRVTDSDRQVGNLPEPATQTANTGVNPATLDSPAHAKGPGPDEIPAPADNSGDLALANLSSEAQRAGKRLGTSGRNENMIAALLREREALAQSSDEDKRSRITQVDEQLQHYGHDPKSDTRSRLPEGRTSSNPSQHTA